MSEDLEAVSCMFCGGDDARVLATAAGSPRRIVKCCKDGPVYLNPRSRANQVLSFHERRFIRDDNLELFASFRAGILRREAEVVKRHKPAGGNLLDVGCATGVLFDYFPEPHWRLCGLDPSTLGTRLSQRRGRAEVVRGTLAAAGFAASFFDVVTILDALYYSSDPLAELKQVARILRPGGIAVVEVPGLHYTLFRKRVPLSLLLDRRWSSLSPESNHLFYFSPIDIRRLFDRVELRLIEAIPEQASLGRGPVWALFNDAHLVLARGLFKLSGGTLSIAGKELYVAQKDGSAS